MPYFIGWPSATTGSIDIGAILKRVNANDGVVRVELALTIMQVQFQCCNHGEQCGGLGNPFDLTSEPIPSSVTVKPSEVSKNGVYYYSDEIDSDQIWAAVKTILESLDVCQNDNWSVDQESLVVTTFFLQLEVYALDREGVERLADCVSATYTLNEGSGDYDLGVDAAHCK
jgi:hypothetical protein